MALFGNRSDLLLSIHKLPASHLVSSKSECLSSSLQCLIVKPPFLLLQKIVFLSNLKSLKDSQIFSFAASVRPSGTGILLIPVPSSCLRPSHFIWYGH